MAHEMTQAQKICLKAQVQQTCLKAQKIYPKVLVQRACLKSWHGHAR